MLKTNQKSSRDGVFIVMKNHHGERYIFSILYLSYYGLWVAALKYF